MLTPSWLEFHLRYTYFFLFQYAFLEHVNVARKTLLTQKELHQAYFHNKRNRYFAFVSQELFSFHDH